MERLGEFEVYQIEGRKVLFLGPHVYASVTDDAYDDWTRGWLEKHAEFYGRGLEEENGREASKD